MADKRKIETPLELSNCKPKQLSQISGIKLDRKEKQVYDCADGTRWMIDFSWNPEQPTYGGFDYDKKVSYKNQPALERLITGKLYELVLGSAAPYEQLVRDSDGKIYMGSRFIDFTPIQNLNLNVEEMVSFMATGKHEKSAVKLENRSFVIAIMALLGENDAHAKNVGFTHTSHGGTTCAKVDHDSSDGIEDNNLKSALNNLNANSNRDLHGLIIKDIPALIEALEMIAGIPDEKWSASVEEAIDSFRAHVPLSNDFAPEQTLEKFNSIKAALPFYINSLRWESAIISGDIIEISKLMLEGLNIHQKYCYAALPGDGSNLVTPLEMAVMAQKIHMFEYLWALSRPALSLQQTVLNACIEHNFQTGIDFMIRSSDFLLQDVKRLELMLLDQSSVGLSISQTLLQMPQRISLPLTLLACRADAYRTLEQASSFSCSQYVEHLLKVPGHCVELRAYLINKELPDLYCGGGYYAIGAREKAIAISKGRPHLNEPVVEVGARNLFKLIANYQDLYNVNPNTLPAFVLKYIKYIWSFVPLFDIKIAIEDECEAIDLLQPLSTFRACGFVEWYQHRGFGKTFCILNDELAISIIESGKVDGIQISKALVRSFENPTCPINIVADLFQTKIGEHVLESIDKSGQKLAIQPFLGTPFNLAPINSANVSYAVKLFIKPTTEPHTIPVFCEDASGSYFLEHAPITTLADALIECNVQYWLHQDSTLNMAINEGSITIRDQDAGVSFIIGSDSQIKAIICLEAEAY